MTAARARGRRGQGTLEFILVLPLLMIMLCAVADYTHLARETANVQT
ncbi:MAG: TadE/TadG family type IV pilus assembly protein, partial [Eggerthella lenta]